MPYEKWTLEKCQEEAKKYSSKIAFHKNASKAFHAAYRNNWIKIVCEHMVNPRTITFEKCELLAGKCKTRSEFKQRFSSAYAAAIRNNWLDEICQNLTEGRKPNNYWTFERCQNVAKNFKTRGTFKITSAAVYKKSCQSGWLDTFFPKEPKHPL